MTLLGLVLVAGALARIWVAWFDDGIYWPDEIYQSLEPAHRLVYGYGLISWEYGLGARGWTFPGLLSGLLYVVSAAGENDPRAYLTVIRLLMVGVGVATAGGSFMLARRLGAQPLFAAVGAAFFALVGPAIYFAPKALSEPASALPIVFGFALALPPDASRRERMIGAALLGLGTLLRFHNAIFCIALVLIWLARRRWRESGDVLGVLAVSAIALGVIDWLTYGGWFQSVILYMRFTADGGGPVTGSAPVTYYLTILTGSMPLAFVTVLILSMVGVRKAPALAAVIGIFFLAHLMTPNKAYRYVLAALPLLGALAAIGLEYLWSRNARQAARLAALVMVAGAIWSLATVRSLTFGDIGPYERTRPRDSVYNEMGAMNRLLIAAGRQPDLCGIMLRADHLVWTGGYSYFHRNVPMYGADGPPLTSGFYNYVITPVFDTVGNPVAIDGDLALRRLGSATCQRDPNFDWRLPGYDDIRRKLGRQP